MTPQLVSKAMIPARGKFDATGFARPRHDFALAKSPGVAQMTSDSRPMQAAPRATAAAAAFFAPTAASPRPHAAPPALKSP